MTVFKGRVERLEKAGLIKPGVKLPPQYRNVLETMSEREVMFLIDLYEDLDQAEKRLRGRKGSKLVDCFIPL
jgi:hypothetical protein